MELGNDLVSCHVSLYCYPRGSKVWCCYRYDRFTFDVTDALFLDNVGTHEVIVRVFSPVDSAHIPVGKQRLHVPGKSIFYSASSGIWQTVWLELVSRLTEHLQRSVCCTFFIAAESQ